MKIKQAESKFQPVVITLESQDEVDQMFALANCVSVKSKTNITYELFDFLEGLQEEGSAYSLEGSLLIK